jgi:hypothetical protein
MAIVRTVVFTEMLRNFENQAVAAVVVSSAFRIAGSSPSNCTSTTAPMTCVMRPAGWRMRCLLGR